MSRIGKNPVVIPANVETRINDGVVSMKGPNGTLEQTMHAHARVELRDGGTGKELVVTMVDLDSKENRSLWGTMRTLLQNMVTGVTEGFKKQLEVNGVGYKVALQGNGLKLDVGFSHSIMYALPDGVKAEVEKNIITLSGASKALVGQTAAEIRKVRPPEPYKGKGIKYVDEVIRRKAGKAAKASA
ncbi:50S ribosomal protein L6 [Candidatus Uhrbacteria bacterium RIFCSPLOWO2_01_FULL_53_9]|uniref:Large ribosomal subunit protein uL6 n=3 Tax=Candidatus Uhriibacteriota TaxID=1752732 RepID=A0A1F7UWV8_9BACT|nr:MAG: 50S ribosomal protein L6 [Candidatus Uhrbacteria bacterium RIFCSPHIGHO2_02_FULL_53_13]OGL82736.1 MAG: 50S ribosomal protein L6 [Candidatus Uhrbacteria bacterium RIFCSPLOWO2_01_FULL_53_9]OGL89092.1 MAG: 50S ribosomal protein L6 [Candidatus Uhrbacteria bacterium RIFCSPLOWO2_02_FULL_53_10]